MKTKALIIAAASICLLFFVAGTAMAGTPSAKFAASWTDTPMAEVIVQINDADADAVQLDLNWGVTIAKIKVPQQKELMVGVSAEIGLITDTSVKGKNGAYASALAGAGVKVVLAAVPEDGGAIYIAAPGPIMLSKRIQELDATLGGVIQSCTLPCAEVCEDVPVYDPTGQIIIGYTEECTLVCEDLVIAEDCIVTDEEIGLLLDTTAAHHFNFVLPDMNQGVYKIVAFFITGAGYDVDVDICDETDPDTGVCVDPVVSSASAYAKAIINKTMVTVQQVRAVKDSLEDITILEP